MNDTKVFFDTNVLLYMYGGDAGKRVRAKQLFRQHAQGGRLLLSTQVVQEFYAAGSRKLGMPRSALREAAAALLDLPLVILGPSHITCAMENEEQYQISFWDALILAAAQSGGAEILCTRRISVTGSNAGQSWRATRSAPNPMSQSSAFLDVLQHRLTSGRCAQARSGVATHRDTSLRSATRPPVRIRAGCA